MIIKDYFKNMDIYNSRKQNIICKYREENNVERLVFRTIHNEQFYVREIQGENWGIHIIDELKGIIVDINRINDALDKLEELGYIIQNIIPAKQFGYKCPVYSSHRRARLSKKGYEISDKLDLYEKINLNRGC